MSEPDAPASKATADANQSWFIPKVIGKRILDTAFDVCIRLSFLQLSLIVLASAVALAIALALLVWIGLYGPPPAPLVPVAAISALLTAAPIVLFLVFVFMKAERTRAALEESNLRFRESRAHQAQTLRKLRAARDDAYAANEAKTQFLANMSHELRTPLNAIIGFSELISREVRGPVGAPEYREYAQYTLESGEHLLAIINEILDISRIETGALQLNRERLDFAKLAARTCVLIEPRAEKASISLRTMVPGDLPCLEADPKAVRQMLLNLLSNALTYTPAGGTVILGARLELSGEMSVFVRDSGVGMREDDIPMALARFSQVDNSNTRKHQGVGLGLPLTQSLIELHGGSMEVSTAPGKGTTVYLRFPCESRPTAGSHPAC